MIGPGTVALRDADLRQARDVMDVMLRPSEFGTTDDWRRAVLEGVKALTGADGGGIFVNGPSGDVWVADYPRVALEAYGIRLAAMAPALDLWARHAALGVHHRDEMWLPIRPDFYETRYYRDYLRPLRAFDALGITWYRGQDRSPSSICQLLLHHDSERGRRFGSRERALLDLVGPALRAGTGQALRTLHPLGEHLEYREWIMRGEGLGLTKRQAAVAVLLAQGKSNKAIARLLGIRPKTVRRHTEHILRRLGISRRGEVAPILGTAGRSIED